MMDPSPGPAELGEVFEDLLISVLAVNNYSLNKAYALCERLRDVGLSDLLFVSVDLPDADDIYKRLAEAGYDRGEYIGSLISARIAAIMRAIKHEGCNEFLLCLMADSATVNAKLGGLYGVGPKVVSNFVSLRGMDKSRIC
jgi:hypothetical protein